MWCDIQSMLALDPTHARLSSLVARALQGCVALLLDAGVDPSQGMPRNGETALMVAAMHDCTDVCAQLIAAGADVNAVSASGTTALANAINYQHTECIVLLTGAGATGYYA